MAGKVVNSVIVARFKLLQRWIQTRSAIRHLPYCKPLCTRLTIYELIKSMRIILGYPPIYVKPFLAKVNELSADIEKRNE